MKLRMIHVDREAVRQEDVHFRWSSIFSGAFITLGFAVFFVLIGNAIGLTIFNTVNPDIGSGLKFASWLYSAVTLILSYGLGSALSSRSKEVTSGGVHGIASWGFATVLGSFFLAVLSPTARSIFDGVGPNTGNWLAACVVVFGLFMSTSSGMLGKQNTSYTPIEEGEFEERKGETG